MKYVKLGRTDITASVIGFGALMLNHSQPDEAAAMVARARELGINYFDVATNYGTAQYALGPAIAPYKNDVYITCKTIKRSAREAEEELNESLRATGREYFDVYQMHTLDDRDEMEQVLGPSGALEAIVKAQKAGKVRYIGMSFHRERSGLYMLSQFDFDTIMHPLNWACMMHNDKGMLVNKLAQQQNKGILALKAAAWGLMDHDEKPTFKNCWYRPLLDERIVELGLRNTLNSGAHVAMTPSSPISMELMAAVVQKYPDIPPLTTEERAELKEASENVNYVFPD